MASAYQEATTFGRAVAQSAFLKSLIEHVADGIGVIDSEGNILYHNTRANTILCIKDEEKVYNLTHLIHPDDLPVFKNTLSRISRSGAPAETASMTMKIHCGNKWKHVALRITPCLHIPEIKGLVVSYRDITEKYTANEQLRQNEEHFRSLIENAFDGITIIDAQGIVKYHSPALQTILGYDPQQSTGQSIFSLMHPSSTKKIQEALESIKSRPGAFYAGLVHFRHKLGYWVTLEARARNLMHHPAIAGIIVNYRDITDRLEAERKLQQSEERYRTLIETAPEAILTVDFVNNRIVDCNRSACRLLGYSKKILLSLSPYDLLPKHQPDGSPSDYLARQKTRQVLKNHNQTFEWLFKRADNTTFPAEVHLSLLPAPQKTLIRCTIIDLTQRKELEQKMRRREKDYFHLALVSPVGIFKSDVKGRCVYVNKNWCLMAGIPAEDALGHNWLKAVHPDDRKKIRLEWQRAIREKSVSRVEFRFKAPNGKITYVYGQAVPDFDDTGKFTGFVGSVTDISERVIAEQALLYSEQQNRALLHAIPDMLLRVSKKGIYLDFKPAESFPPILSPEQFIGKHIRDIMPPQISKLAMRLIREALQTKNTKAFEYALTDPVKGETFFEARITPYTDDELLILVRDITAQRKAQKALRESEEKWRSLVNSAPQYIATIDKNDRFTFINHLYMLKPEQVLGKHLLQIIHPGEEKTKELLKLLKRARKSMPGSMELSTITPKGDVVWFDLKVAPLKSSEKSDELILMAYDITERKKAQEEIQLAHEKLKMLYMRLDKIREEEKRNIALEIHDELGQQLTAIRLGLYWLQQYADRDNWAVTHPEVIEKIKTLLEINAETVASARRLAHQLRPIVLDKLGLIPAIEWQVKNVTDSSHISCTFTHRIPHLKFNQEFIVALFRIVQEALTNAMKHSEASEILIDLRTKARHLILTIHDNGKGIRKEQIQYSEGCGMFGMKERTANWNGNLAIRGTPGKGTLIKATFPLQSITIP
ncbi:MAG: hypothetical protein KatS3mg031_1440 [Chitinophagales bacterium]|nr:MAG: hypothetical protein KatS3mg031_1440 [Chitinophagales bacterium]